MARVASFGSIVLLAAICFAAAVMGGATSAGARVSAEAANAQPCCLYMIF